MKFWSEGKKSFIFSQPFRIRVFIANHEDNIHELEGLDKKLTGGSGKLLSKELKNLIAPKDVDGWVSIKYYRHGLYMMEIPPIGNGKVATVADVLKRLTMRGISPERSCYPKLSKFKINRVYANGRS